MPMETHDGHGRARGRQDHRPLERHRHLHRQGHRLPALEARPARPRFPLQAVPHLRRTAASSGSTTSDAVGGDDRRERRRTSAAARPSTTSSTRASRTRRTSCGAASRRSRPRSARRRASISPTRWSRSRPPPARSWGFELSAEERARPFVEMSGRKGLGVKADDLIDRSKRTRCARSRTRHPEVSRRRAARDGARHRRRRAPLLPAEVDAQLRHRLRLQRGALVRRARPALTASTRPCAPTPSFASCQTASCEAAQRLRRGAAEGDETTERVSGVFEGESGGEIWSLVTLAARLDEVDRAGRVVGGAVASRQVHVPTGTRL